MYQVIFDPSNQRSIKVSYDMTWYDIIQMLWGFLAHVTLLLL